MKCSMCDEWEDCEELCDGGHDQPICVVCCDGLKLHTRCTLCMSAQGIRKGSCESCGAGWLCCADACRSCGRCQGDCCGCREGHDDGDE